MVVAKRGIVAARLHSRLSSPAALEFIRSAHTIDSRSCCACSSYQDGGAMLSVTGIIFIKPRPAKTQSHV
jgi:hypothetical protein